MKNLNKKVYTVLTASIFLVACSVNSSVPDIAGKYIDNYQQSQVVGDKNWVSSIKSTFEYVVVDNPSSYLTAKNSDENKYYPSKFSRFEWARSDDKLWYCQQVYNANTAEDANNFTVYPQANSSNPSATGCGLGDKQFPWSELIAK